MVINDCKYAAYYRDIETMTQVPPVGTEHINDLESLWLRTQLGLPTDSPLGNNDLWFRYFDSQGVLPGQFNDRMFKWLGNMGYTQGSLSDREYQFWCVDGGVPTDVVTYNGEPVTYQGEELTVVELNELLTIGSMTISDPYEEMFSNGTYTPITFTEIVTNPPDMDVNLTTNSITVSRSGLYKVSVGANCIFANSKRLGLLIHLDGTPAVPRPWSSHGEGTGDPVSLYWSAMVDLAAGTILDFRGTNLESGSVDVEFLHSVFTVEWKGDIAP